MIFLKPCRRRIVVLVFLETMQPRQLLPLNGEIEVFTFAVFRYFLPISYSYDIQRTYFIISPIYFHWHLFWILLAQSGALVFILVYYIHTNPPTSSNFSDLKVLFKDINYEHNIIISSYQFNILTLQLVCFYLRWESVVKRSSGMSEKMGDGICTHKIHVWQMSYQVMNTTFNNPCINYYFFEYFSCFQLCFV